MPWLPENYTVPTDSNYMTLLPGSNRFRALSNPIMGWEYWIDNPEDKSKRKPIRKRTVQEIDTNDIGLDDEVKHFWAFVVWNYRDVRIQILEITQKSVMNPMTALQEDPDYSDPKQYDVTIARSGNDKNSTKYSVLPGVPKPIDPSIIDDYNRMNINLEALFTGDDPFAFTAKPSESKSSIDEEPLPAEEAASSL